MFFKKLAIFLVGLCIIHCEAMNSDGKEVSQSSSQSERQERPSVADLIARIESKSKPPISHSELKEVARRREKKRKERRKKKREEQLKKYAEEERLLSDAGFMEFGISGWGS